MLKGEVGEHRVAWRGSTGKSLWEITPPAVPATPARALSGPSPKSHHQNAVLEPGP